MTLLFILTGAILYLAAVVWAANKVVNWVEEKTNSDGLGILVMLILALWGVGLPLVLLTGMGN